MASLHPGSFYQEGLGIPVLEVLPEKSMAGKGEQTVIIQFEHGRDFGLQRRPGLEVKVKNASTLLGEEWQLARGFRRLTTLSSTAGNLAW